MAYTCWLGRFLSPAYTFWLCRAIAGISDHYCGKKTHSSRYAYVYSYSEYDGQIVLAKSDAIGELVAVVIIFIL